MIRLPGSILFTGLLVASLLCGCDSAPTGSAVKVTVASQKLKLEETDSVEVIFTPQGTGTPATANGSVKDQPLAAGRGETPGVLPGKYTLSVRITPYAGMATPQRVDAITESLKQFEPNKSTLTYEVTSEKEQAITVDLDANAVKKQ